MAELDPRRDLGTIATLDDGTVIHYPGSVGDAMRRVAAYCDARGRRVRCLSTPATILQDLQGRERPDSLPEHRLLGLIGRTDLYG